MKRRSNLTRNAIARPLLIVLAIGVLAAVAWAAGHPGYAAEKAVIKADRRGWGDTNKGTINLEGNVSIVFGDMRISCQEAEIDADGKTGKLSGSVVLTDKGVTIKSEALDMNLQKRQGVFSGRVSLVREEERSDQGGKVTVTKERVEVACDRLEANTSKRTFEARGNVELVHSDFDATCETARFDEKAESLVMTGQVVLMRKEKERLTANQVNVDLKARKFTATQSVELTFEVEEESAEVEPGPEEGDDEEPEGEAPAEDQTAGEESADGGTAEETPDGDDATEGVKSDPTAGKSEQTP